MLVNEINGISKMRGVRCSSSTLAMEHCLHERDRVGLQDFVLLEDFQNEAAFLDNLRKRFQENIIYTYIGQVLISVNPYKQLPIYDEEHIKEYKNMHFFEVPPHVFAITDNAFRSLIEECKGQCVLISGESGSGKTEASKKVLQYIAACSDHQLTVEGVKDKLLNSNPLLEAFGNAKTNRNNNSSRFGKYMDITFDFAGTPTGGKILNYLLEKSRVVQQNASERNFHIFYQLLAGSSDEQLNSLRLQRSVTDYKYLSDGMLRKNSLTIHDKQMFEVVEEAIKIINFNSREHQEIFEIVASILHLGNVEFSDDNEHGQAAIEQNQALQAFAELLQIDLSELSAALVNRTIDANGDVVTSPLSRDNAIYGRDALAKAIYDRLFTWLVSRLNISLHSNDDKDSNPNLVIGILDIYGFEIFQNNSFEQFCINFCNEKLQQLFIELTLKYEQLEYKREGIEWVPISFFDNKVICNLIEEKYKGIIAILDEECLRPGETSDVTFLDKLSKNLCNHPHFLCHEKASAQIQKTMTRYEFRLVHYAGDVTYDVRGFLDKNNDLLYRDLKETMGKSNNNLIRACFPKTEYYCRKRPITAISQFKTSLNNLVDILMNKEPTYIRCIKPNETQVPGKFNDKLVLHQIKYLGLMENLRVRRAGFAYRRTYDMFLRRYKCLSKETWLNFNGTAKEGVEILVKKLNYDPEDYRMGESKLFIRFPKTLFDTEDAFQLKKHEIAAILQSKWKAILQRRKYLALRNHIIKVQSYCRRYLVMHRMVKRRKAICTIQKFVRGFLTRHEPPNIYNISFIENNKRLWLLYLAKNLPKTVLDRSWPSAPSYCQAASEQIYVLHRSHLARIYRLSLTPDQRRQLQLKVLAESVFKGKKSSYNASINHRFQNDRTPDACRNQLSNFVAATFVGEHLKYATYCTKYDRHGYKSRERYLLLSNLAIYVVDGKNFKQKHRLPLQKINFVVTNYSDDLVVIHIPLELEKDKGDLILMIPYLIEFCTFVIDTAGNTDILNIVGMQSLEHNVVKGKSGIINIQTGAGEPSVMRNKNGHLVIMVGQ